MIPTSQSDEIGDFLGFLRALPGGARAVEARRGASSDEVARLAGLARHPLPRLYAGYLREFGHGDGPLKLADDADPTVDRLTAFYEEQARVDYWDLPFLATVIALPGLSGWRSLLYEETLAEEPQVAITWGEEVSHVVAGSFRGWLYHQAYARFRVQQAEGRCGFLVAEGPGVPTLAQVAAFFERSGFAPYWFNDAYAYSAERDGLWVQAQSQRDGVEVLLGGASVEARDHLTEALVGACGLRPSGPRR